MSTDVARRLNHFEDEKVEEIQFDVESDSIKYLSISERNNIALEYRFHARKMAHGILARWRAHLNTEDLYSIVDQSLCEAVSRFDPERGVSFITFLFYHLKGNLVKAIKYQTKGSVVSFINDEIKTDDDFSYKRVGSRLMESEGINEVSLFDMKMIESPEESLLNKESVNVVALACEKLDKIEKEIIYRLFIKEEHVFNVATSLGYSRCHVSRIKKSALINLRREICRIYEEMYKEGGNTFSRAPRQVVRRQSRSRKVYETPVTKKAIALGM